MKYFIFYENPNWKIKDSMGKNMYYYADKWRNLGNKITYVGKYLIWSLKIDESRMICLLDRKKILSWKIVNLNSSLVVFSRENNWDYD